VGASTTGLTDGASNEAASLVLTGSQGFLLAPGGELYAGPVDDSADWTKVAPIVSSCSVGKAQPTGQPSSVMLGAVTAKELILGCAASSSAGNGAADEQAKQLYSSPNGGVSWLAMAKAPKTAPAYSLAASPSETVILGTDEGIDVLPAGDIAWQTATLDGSAPSGGFSYVGMTTDEQGIALPANPSSGTVWFTFDGGRNWAPSHL
jgi:hypothetical protein